MENKYFTPDIEDICIGYECEINDALGYKVDYIKCIIDDKVLVATSDNSFEASSLSSIIDMVNDGYGRIKTPYLTKEQIEAEGWKIAAKDSFTPLFRKSNFTLGYREEDNKLKIQTFGENSYTLYYGKCKCINDLRKIIKLLGL